MAAQIELGPGTVDLDGRWFRPVDGAPVRLSQRESDLLELLADDGGTVHRDTLLTQVWGWSADTPTRAVDAAIRRLRRKIEPQPDTPTVLLGVYGEGYRLVRERPTRPASPQLPRPLEPLLGRRDLLQAARDTLAAGRPLLTLVGPGGIGKTRLALELAQEASATRPVHFVQLEHARDADTASGAVAAALGVGAAAIPAALAAADALLVLDNLEQALPAVAPLVARWLASGPVRIVATSRERLGLAGERVLELPPLEVDAALQLYGEQAEAAGRSVTDGDREAIVALIARLDGNPLALELAAAWAPVRGPEAVLAQLDDSPGGLKDPRGGRVARHASLDALLGWSWDLLVPDQQHALVDLGQFPGPFDAEAALEAAAVQPDVLLALRQKSLLRMAGGDLVMPQGIRSWVAARADGVEPARRLRFARWWARQARSLADALHHARSPTALAHLAVHVRAGRRALADLEPREAAAAVVQAGDALDALGSFAAHQAWVDEVLDRLDDGDPSRPTLLRQRTAVRLVQGQLGEAGPAADAALAACRGLGGILEAEAWVDHATLAMMQDRPTEGRVSTEQAIAVLPPPGSVADRRAGRVMMFAAANFDDLDDVQRAQHGYLAALTYFEQAGAPRDQAAARLRLAGLAIAAGDVDTAEAHIEAAEGRLAAFAPGQRRTASLCRMEALLAELQGDYPTAADLAAELLERATAAGEPWTGFDADLLLARAALVAHDLPIARHHVERAQAFARERAWVSGQRVSGVLRVAIEAAAGSPVDPWLAPLDGADEALARALVRREDPGEQADLRMRRIAAAARAAHGVAHDPAAG